MQTFLPCPDFLKSALCLDKKRCWKQAIEAKQIIEVLEGRSVAWANHPAVKMWKGHIDCLKNYFNYFLFVSVKHHNINTKLINYDFNIEKAFENLPWWLGNEYFHRSHRARLIEKNTEFYLPLFPEDKGFNGGKYFWPDMETKTFKIIN